MDKKTVLSEKKEVPIIPPHMAAAQAESDALDKAKADEAADKKAAAAKAAADKAGVKAAAKEELQAKQVYEEEEHDNPFDNIFRAQITEVRKNKDEKVFVQFVAFRADYPDIKEPIANLPENEFRDRFAKFIS